MKIWLDDERPEPCKHIWTRALNYPNFERLVKDNKHIITHISFDHDLGYSDPLERTGYHAACLIEELAASNDINPAIQLAVHSANPSGAQRIFLVLQRAIKFVGGDPNTVRWHCNNPYQSWEE